MNAFTYSLQRVLDARAAKTSLCEVKLAQAERRLQACKTQEQTHKKSWQQQAEEQAADNQRKPAHELRTARAWILHLANRVDQSIRDVVNQAETVNQQREQLKKSLMEQKIIENHAKHQRRHWLEEKSRSEQKLLDEQASHVSRRARQANSGTEPL